MLDFSIVFYTQ